MSGSEQFSTGVDRDLEAAILEQRPRLVDRLLDDRRDVDLLAAGGGKRDDPARDQQNQQRGDRDVAVAAAALIVLRDQRVDVGLVDCCRGNSRESGRAARVELCGVDRLAELVGRLEAKRRILGERLEDDGVKRRRDLRVDLRRRLRLLGDLLQRDRDRRVGFEGRATRERLVEHHPDRVEVRRRGHREPLRLLGREVLGRSEHRAGLRDLRRAGAGDAEVRDPGAALAVDEDVLRLQVAMDDPVLVRELRAGEDLADDLERLADREPAADQVLERCALDVLHRDEVPTVGLAAVVHADDVLVLHPRGRLGLAAEALDELGVLGEALVQELQRDPALEHLVVGEPHVRHPAAAEAGDEHVAIRDSLALL